MGALKEPYEHGAEHWDQKLGNFLFCDNGKVIVVDLEEVRFPDKCGPWEDSVNLGGVLHLMSDFRSIREPNRPSSPISFRMTRPDNGGTLGTARPSGSAQLMKRKKRRGTEFYGLSRCKERGNGSYSDNQLNNWRRLKGRPGSSQPASHQIGDRPSLKVARRRICSIRARRYGGGPSGNSWHGNPDRHRPGCIGSARAARAVLENDFLSPLKCCLHVTSEAFSTRV